MLIATRQQKELLSTYVPNYTTFNDLGDILSALNDVMLESLDENDESTDETAAIARLYDEIYVANAA